MRYMALIGVWPGEKTEEVLELRNSWGGLMYVWENMAEKYLRLTKAYDYPQGGYMQRMDDLWPLWKQMDIPEEHRLVFMWGFDRAYITKENYPRMVKAIRKFLADFPPKSENVNHWEAIAQFLETADEPAIGIYGTSVGDNVWNGDWDEETDSEKPLEWDKFYDCCAEIDALKEEATK